MFDQGWDAGLDDTQLSAAAHGDGPLVILAGAGTGKTRTLTARVASLVDRGVPPERVLLLTFTRRAADDMLARAAAMCTREDAGSPTAGRHVPCRRPPVGRPAHRSARSAAGTVGARQVGLDRRDGPAAARLRPRRHRRCGLRGPATLVDIYSRSVNTGRPARHIVATEFRWVEPHLEQIMKLLRGYVARKRERGLIDFDDLLLAWRSLLTDPILGPEIAGRWDHVLVDEYQDVNQIQVDIVRALRPDGRGLTVVGDDAQAVYGFRGADSAHLLDLTTTSAGRHRRPAGTQLPVPAAAAGPGQRGAAQFIRSPTRPAFGPAGRPPGPAGALPRRPRRGPGHRRRRADRGAGRAPAPRAGGADADLPPQRPAGGRTDRPAACRSSSSAG